MVSANELGIGTGIGSPKGDARATPGSPKRRAREMQGLIYISALFATEIEKGRVGHKKITWQPKLAQGYNLIGRP